MPILRDLSLAWSYIHIVLLFISLYEPRYPKKKSIALILSVMIPIGIINVGGVILYGSELMAQLMALTCTLPSGIFFFIIAKNRNWRFLFTLFSVAAISYEILVFSRIADYFLFGDKYIAMLIIRLLAYPLLEWLAYRYIRKPFLEITNGLKKGWVGFTGIVALYYALLIISVGFPTIVFERPEDIPLVLLICVLLPATFAGVFIALYNQMKLQNAENREQILGIQTSELAQRINEFSAMEEKLRIQRHDMRHRYSVISEMLNEGKHDEVIAYVNETKHSLDEGGEKLYCLHPVLNAVFTYFIRRAEENNIHTDIQLAIPENIDLNITEFSVMIANVFENAINGNLTLPPENRYINCKSITSPQFVFRISNPFEGMLSLSESGIPITSEKGHGVGIQSVIAFCEKYDIYYEFKIEDGLFVFSMTKY